MLALKDKFELIPVCPEVMGGLPTPRPPAARCRDKILTETGSDVTNEYFLGAEIALQTACRHNIDIAVLKEKSPSCGKGRVYDGSHTKTLTDGDGVTAELFIKNGIAVYGENEVEKIKRL